MCVKGRMSPDRSPGLFCSSELYELVVIHLSNTFSHLHAREAAASPPLCLALHLLADLHVDLEELCDAAIKADRLALVEIGFAVRVDALFAAGLNKAAQMVSVRP